MRAWFSRLACCSFAGLFVIVPGCLLVRIFAFENLNRLPPHQAFERVMHMPVPPGVHDLKVSGITSLSGVAFLSFTADDVEATLKALQGNEKLPLGTKDQSVKNQLDFFQGRYYSDYMAQVDWGRITIVQRPEYYPLPKAFHGSGWNGVLVLDREAKQFLIGTLLY